MGFDEIYDSVVVSKRSILRLVDEYTLYCFYTGLQELNLRAAYPAPYRRDRHPSFTVYRILDPKPNDVEFLWRDHSTGESGDIFSLICKIHGVASISQVYSIISRDFGLDLAAPASSATKICWNSAPVTSATKIRIGEIPFTEAGLQFWSNLGITLELLEKYLVHQVRYYWTWQEQPAPNWAPDPTFAYRIGRYYQLYFPTNPHGERFKMDWPEGYFFGYLQLPAVGQKLVIDKSAKDALFCVSLGYSAVAVRAESVLIHAKHMSDLLRRFTEIYLTPDDDPAGHRLADKYVALYPAIRVRFLKDAKDKTDLVAATGLERAVQITRKLLT